MAGERRDAEPLRLVALIRQAVEMRTVGGGESAGHTPVAGSKVAASCTSTAARCPSLHLEGFAFGKLEAL